MKSAKLLTTQIYITNNDFMFLAKGKTIKFDGLLKSISEIVVRMEMM